MARIQVTVDWDAVKADPVVFIRTLLRHPDGSVCEPFDAQQELLRNIRRNTAIVTGRQWGKSTSIGWYGTWFGATKPNKEVMILAPTLDQTKLIFREILHYYSKAPLKSLVDGKPKSSPFPELTLKNGTRYYCRGLNSPAFVRGNHPHLVLFDEAAFAKEGTLKDVVEPLLTVTGKLEDSALVLTSTPFGQGEFYNYYNACIRNAAANNPRYATFHYSSLTNPHADMEYLNDIRERYGEDSPTWQAEYLGNFQDDEMSVFTTADIKAATERWLPEWSFPLPPIEKHRYIQGVDLANQRDYFVSTNWDATDRNAITLARMDRYRKRGYTYYKGVVRNNYALYNRARTILDATTVAESVVEDLSDISPVGYKIGSNAAKHEIVHELVRLFSEHRIILPPDQKDILFEFAHFRYKLTASGNVQMEAPRGLHDDIVMSSALAAHLAVIPSLVGSFVSVDLSPRNPVPAARRSREEIPDFWEGCFD